MSQSGGVGLGRGFDRSNKYFSLYNLNGGENMSHLVVIFIVIKNAA